MDPEIIYAIAIGVATLFGWLHESRRSARETKVEVDMNRTVVELQASVQVLDEKLTGRISEVEASRADEEIVALRASHNAWVELFDKRLDSLSNSDLAVEVAALKASHNAWVEAMDKRIDGLNHTDLLEGVASLRTLHNAWAESFDTRLTTLEVSAVDTAKTVSDLRVDTAEQKAKHEALVFRTEKLEAVGEGVDGDA